MGLIKISEKPSSFSSRHKIDWAPILLFLIAFGGRSLFIRDGLPLLFFPDEPHHVNIAARMGTFDFNPHDFKYPTFWAYGIAALFGVLFVIQRALGQIASVSEFAVAFVCHPSVFYMSVRILSAVLIGASAAVVYYVGKHFYDRESGFFMGGALALAPGLFPYGRDGTPYALMIFMLALSFYALHAFLANPTRRKAVLLGFFIGLSMATHYLAAPFFLTAITALVLFPWARRYAIVLLLSTLAGVFVGSPYLFLDCPHVITSLTGLSSAHSSPELTAGVLRQRLVAFINGYVTFFDPFGVSFLFLLVGVFRQLLFSGKKIWLWLPMIIVLLPVLLLSQYGSAIRYSFVCLFPFLLWISQGISWIPQGFGRKIFVFCLFFLYVLFDVQWLRDVSLPDTREAAFSWIKANIEPHSVFAVSDHYRCPQLPMAHEQARRLKEKCEQLEHPRAAYYDLKSRCDTFGYVLYYQKHDVAFLADVVARAESSYAAQETIDIGEGIAALKAKGIRYLLIDGDSATHYRWEKELSVGCRPLKNFPSYPGLVRGPDIVIYEIL